MATRLLFEVLFTILSLFSYLVVCFALSIFDSFGSINGLPRIVVLSVFNSIVLLARGQLPPITTTSCNTGPDNGNRMIQSLPSEITIGQNAALF